MLKNKKFEIATAFVAFLAFMAMFLVTCGIHDYNLYIMFHDYEMAEIAKNVTWALTAVSFILTALSIGMIRKCE